MQNTAREDAELKQSTDLPLHSSTGGLKTVIDSSHQQHGGSKSGSATPKGLDTHRPRHEHWTSKDEGDFGRPNASPLRHESAVRKTNFDSPHHHHGALTASETPRKVTRQGVGSDRSIEHSPLHPQSQVRAGGKGSGFSSPSWERKASSEGSHGLAPLTPGRSRLRSVTRGDDTPDHSPAVPKFGDWDENDPAAAEGYTHIFNKVREEKQTGGGKVPVMAAEASYSNGQRRDGYDNLKGCRCFPWSKR